MSESISEAIENSKAMNAKEPQTAPISGAETAEAKPFDGPVSPGTAVQSETNSEADLKPVIELAISIPYDIAASRTGFEGFRLSKDEASAIATQADLVMKTYFPQITSAKEASLIALGATITLVTLAKYGEYQAWKQVLKQKKTKSVSEVEKPKDVFPIERAE